VAVYIQTSTVVVNPMWTVPLSAMQSGVYKCQLSDYNVIYIICAFSWYIKQKYWFKMHAVNNFNTEFKDQTASETVQQKGPNR
jgi:hypothetical protein